jgi:hypothetical protein
VRTATLSCMFPGITQEFDYFTKLEDCDKQVQVWENTDTLISWEAARAISHAFNSRSTDFYEFTFYHTISDTFAESIDKELVNSSTQVVRRLKALKAFIMACWLNTFIIGQNVEGYIPEDDSERTFLNYTEAIRAYYDMLREYADGNTEKEKDLVEYTINSPAWPANYEAQFYSGSKDGVSLRFWLVENYDKLTYSEYLKIREAK